MHEPSRAGEERGQHVPEGEGSSSVVLEGASLPDPPVGLVIDIPQLPPLS